MQQNVVNILRPVLRDYDELDEAQRVERLSGDIAKDVDVLATDLG